MKRILLVCSAGMSTSIIVTKMKKAAIEQGIDIEVEAKPNASIAAEKGNWDIVLIGPQIRFAHNQVKTDLGNIPSLVIPMREYGLGDGKSILKLALELE